MMVTSPVVGDGLLVGEYCLTAKLGGFRADELGPSCWRIC